MSLKIPQTGKSSRIGLVTIFIFLLASIFNNCWFNHSKENAYFILEAFSLLDHGIYAIPGADKVGYGQYILTSLNKANVSILALLLALFGKASWWYAVKIVPILFTALTLYGLNRLAFTFRLPTVAAIAILVLTATDPLIVASLDSVRFEPTLTCWVIFTLLAFIQNESHPSQRSEWGFALLFALGHWVTMASFPIMAGFGLGILLSKCSLRAKASVILKMIAVFSLVVVPYYVWIYLSPEKLSLFQKQLAFLQQGQPASDTFHAIMMSVMKPLNTLSKMAKQSPSVFFLLSGILLTLTKKKKHTLDIICLCICVMGFISTALGAYVSHRRLYYLVPIGYLLFFKNFDKDSLRSFICLGLSGAFLLLLHAGFSLIQFIEANKSPAERILTAAPNLLPEYFNSMGMLSIVAFAVALIFSASLFLPAIYQRTEAIKPLFIIGITLALGFSAMSTAKLRNEILDDGAINFNQSTIATLTTKLGNEIPTGSTVYASDKLVPLLAQRNDAFFLHWSCSETLPPVFETKPPAYIVMSQPQKNWFKRKCMQTPMQDLLTNQYSLKPIPFEDYTLYVFTRLDAD